MAHPPESLPPASAGVAHGRFATLDAMRGFAAVAVMLYHFHRPFAESAYLAVDFFYVLSGFVLCEAYLAKLKAGLSVRDFMKIRVVRLYPMYIVGVALGAFYALARLVAHKTGMGAEELGISLTSAVFLLPSPGYFLLPKVANDYLPLYPLDGPAWSIFWELVVNVLFVGGLYQLRLRFLAVLMAVCLAALAVAAFGGQGINVGWQWTNIGGGFGRVLFSFGCGMAIYHLRHGKRRLSGWLALTPVLALMAILSCNVPASCRPWFDLAFVALISPALVVMGAACELPPSLRRAGEFIGYLSYPVYIMHRPLMDFFAPVFDRIHVAPLAQSALFLGGVALSAYGATRLAERPLKRLLQKILTA